MVSVAREPEIGRPSTVGGLASWGGRVRPVVFVAIAVATALSLGCADDFKPETDVEGLRVLGMRAEPAELRPGQLAQLSALVVDPSAPTRRNTLVWISCDPDPFDLNRSACSDLSQLSDSSELFSTDSTDGGTAQLPPGMKLAGFGEHAFYVAPENLFAALDPADPRRKTGTVAQMLLLAIAEEVPPNATQEQLQAVLERVRNKEVASIMAIFRVPVSEAEQQNHNPIIGDVLVDGVPVPEGAHLAVTAGRDALVRFTAPAEALEEYDQPVPDGTEHRTERLIAAPYATGGVFTFDRVAVNEDFDTVFTPPSGTDDDPLPQKGRGRFWVVVRDTRGGQSWREHTLHFCEDAAPVPGVVRVTPDTFASSGGETIALEGERIDRVLDVLIGGAAVRDGVYSPAQQKFVGTAPPLPSGTYPVRVRTVDCVELDTGLRVTVP